MIQLSWADVILSSFGGLLISLSTSFHLLTKGRVTGFSVWYNTQIFDDPKLMISRLNYIGYGLSGFLVGLGTKLSNGCTSGHGVCGLPRFSIRSWVSVDQLLEILIGLLTGILFALGLGFGGMLRRSKINGFLSLQENWDPSLMFLLCFAVGGNMITFYFIQKKKKPLYSDRFYITTNKQIDLKLIMGSFIFGIGWGIGSLCPGPALALFSIFSIQISVVWICFLALGQLIVGFGDIYLKVIRQKIKIIGINDNVKKQQNQQFQANDIIAEDLIYQNTNNNEKTK
ncbi:hypothetical protein IMG5_122880 [Ichthyophthirius multifiliis]|uniref:Sulphur transport domain-containing protein n=1 Tax=Ichthyophthirius multifiliis TaxID=5932 RepID=G0QVC7_ICHMU|nr:hypothetical protein IMG5_122880 [Ichthyophthirius multifiliis]EGR30816.1 hypothetical protein IMG5_122880 [Ichthyophthirius multifiliis]|eukprot:XP_004032403.1 hypothetical protein IMG5_122880 [Ichthyophthirius multifiliis]